MRLFKVLKNFRSFEAGKIYSLPDGTEEEKMRIKVWLDRGLAEEVSAPASTQKKPARSIPKVD